MKDHDLLIIAPSFPSEDDSFIGGVFIKNQVAELKRFFNKITVISPVFRSFGYVKKDKACKDYSYDNVEVNFPRCFYIPISWLNKVVIDGRTRVVKRTIDKQNIHFNLIHAHFTWPSGYIAAKLRQQYHVPVLTTVHENTDWLDREIKMNHPYLKMAWSGANILIRVNKKDVKALKHFNESTVAIPNGFSPSFHPMDTTMAREKLALPIGAKIIFSLGLLRERKGFDYLINAMTSVCEHRNDILCYIGGSGVEYDRLKEQINQLHLESSVKLLGRVPGDQLPLWMNACDVFTLPSLSEGNPTVMFEALGCGKPFIGTRVGGVPEVITSDEYGLLVEPGSSSDLAEKLLSALGRQWDREAIVQYAQQYTWENVSRELVQQYRQALGSPPSDVNDFH